MNALQVWRGKLRLAESDSLTTSTLPKGPVESCSQILSPLTEHQWNWMATESAHLPGFLLFFNPSALFCLVLNLGGEPEMVRFIVIHLPTHARKSNSAFGGGKNTSQFDMRSKILQFDTQGEKS